MFERVLVAVDGSAHARKACTVAVDLAKRYGAKLFILSVAHEPSDRMREQLERFMETERVQRSLDDLVIEESVQDVLAEAETAARTAGVQDVETVGRVGHPAKRILEFAEMARIDLIVMGTRGLGEVEGLILGSVSHRVGASAKCSCLMVR
ncbi:MAG: universal stress protein [Rhodospirillaceae bacterium]|nr:universal stress protein [Rhodospirillaceae bacterium]